MGTTGSTPAATGISVGGGSSAKVASKPTKRTAPTSSLPSVPNRVIQPPHQQPFPPGAPKKGLKNVDLGVEDEDEGMIEQGQWLVN